MSNELPVKAETNFPTASKVSERHTVSTFKMTWAMYRKEAGITDKTPLAEVKRHQAIYTEQRDNAVKENRAIASALVSNSDFTRISRQTWTDKGGNRQVQIRLSDKPFSVKSSDKAAAAAVAEVQAELEKAKQKNAAMLSVLEKLGISEEDKKALGL